jgi:tRNA G18 (ribose-2'-O)-methylase SpoU
MPGSEVAPSPLELESQRLLPAPASAGLSGVPAHSQSRDCFLLFHGLSKKHNIGTMLRTAAAFGVKEALVSGGCFSVFGAKGAERHVPVREFERLADAARWVKARGAKLVGIEISRDAVDVATRPFSGSVCFLAGNEGAGLSEAQKALCDDLVYIRHFGNGTASLNVATATAIVLHHYAEWCGRPERAREDGADKFAVEPINRPVDSELARDKRAERARVRAHDGGSDGDEGVAAGLSIE